jgi:hypothetical protein
MAGADGWQKRVDHTHVARSHDDEVGAVAVWFVDFAAVSLSSRNGSRNAGKATRPLRAIARASATPVRNLNKPSFSFMTLEILYPLSWSA